MLYGVMQRAPMAWMRKQCWALKMNTAYAASVSRYAASDTARNGSFTDDETMDIDVTFYLSESNTYAVSNANFSTLLKKAAMNVIFGLDEADIEDKVLTEATDRFLTILNKYG